MPSNWTTLTVDGNPMPAYVSSPEGPGPHPAVVVAMHVFGIDRFIKGKCDDLAAAGYVAIAPYLFHRSDVTNEKLTAFPFGVPERAGTAMPLKDALKDNELMADMLAAANHVRSLPNVGGPLGVTGFCIGGRVAYLMAVRSDEFSACAVFYGTDVHLPWGDEKGPAPLDFTADLNCPLAGFFGNDDYNPTPADVDRLEAELKRQGKRYEFHRYDGAPHAFNDPFNPVRYTPAAAEDAWPKLIAFFDGALKQK